MDDAIPHRIPRPYTRKRGARRRQAHPQLLPDDKGPQDACGVFGVWAPGEQVAKLTYFGLYALQHRGQEAAGIAVSDGSSLVVYKDLGLVSQVFDEVDADHPAGPHRRRAHPLLDHRLHDVGERAAELPHHAGRHRPRARPQRQPGQHRRARRRGARGRHRAARIGATTDSDLLTALLAARPDVSVEQAAMEVLPKLRGAFSLVFMDEHTLYAARDPQGVRPLVLGRLERGWVVTSETAALDIVGASFVREIEPGELIADRRGRPALAALRRAEPKGCVFEYVYLARPDTTIAGRSVHSARVEVGPPAGQASTRPRPTWSSRCPESGTPAAIGYAEASGIPYGLGLVKNSYVGRTFIQPSQTIRQLGIRLKLNPLRDVIRGKRLVVVDDSIVRGNTQRALVRMLREAGALEVHVRISAPPVKWPCFYGIDFASRAELIANGLDDDGIRASIGADSLGYVSLESLIAATEQPKTRLCRACFDGEYPIPLPEVVGKHVLEGIEQLGRSRRREPRAGAASASYAAEDALTRP